MTPQLEPKLSLYSIERELFELLEVRNQAVEEGALPEDLEAIDKTIQAYFVREVRKVDGICRALRSFENAANEAGAEAVRISYRAQQLQEQADRIRAFTLKAMQDHGVRVLETPTNKLRVQANGGREPLEVTDELAIPEAFQQVSVTMSACLWRSLSREMSEADCREVGVTTFQNNDAIRQALKQRLPCPDCIPKANTLSGPCARCEGKGTIPNPVAGARLLPRGVHLRIE